MRTLAVACVMLGVLGATTARAADEPPLVATLTNGEGTCTYSVEGRAPQLPNGTALHVGLIVRGIQPSISATFFRVTVQNGSYAGSQEWEARTFAPDFYTTQVRLHMDSQPPGVKATLQKEFGYTQDQIVDIATIDTGVGTPEEQLAHLTQTLVVLRDLCDRLEALRARLVAQPAPTGPEDPVWSAFATQLTTDTNAALADYDQTFNSRVVWAQAAMFESLGQSFRELLRLTLQVGRGEAVAVRRISAMQQRLSRLRAEIVSRIPEEKQPPGQH
jgi:hypothetical protein